MNKPKLIRMVTIDHVLNILTGQLAFLNNDFEVIAVATDTGHLDKIARRERIRRIRVDMRREISPWNDLRSLWELIRLFLKERPAIVHANSPKASLLGMTAAWVARVPSRIYTVTGLRFETTTGALRLVLKTVERITCALATKVIPEGDGVKATLEREGITRKASRKLHNGNMNGVDLDHFKPDQALKSKVEGSIDTPAGCFRFIFIGRIVKDKGVNELVEAFVRLNKTYPDTRLLLLGIFEDDYDPISPAARAAIAGNPCIEYAGYQDDIRPYLSVSDVLVLPSHREGFPNVILQAGAMGLPCIVSDVNGCNEAIVDRKNGLIVPKESPAELYHAMERMLDEPGLVSSLASQARTVVASDYDCHDVWNATLAMYKASLEDRQSMKHKNSQTWKS